MSRELDPGIRQGEHSAARTPTRRPRLPALPPTRTKLPDLVAALNGQIDIDLIGRIDTVPGGGLRTRFETVPDAPVTRFTLNLDGGQKGLLENSVNLCKVPQRVLAAVNGQNGATENQNQKLGTPCGKAAKRKRQRRARVVG